MTQDEIKDFFDAFGPVTVRKMFGGAGIYHEGLIFALEGDGEILLKADADSAPDFAAAGARQFIYEGKGKVVAMPYWTVPEEAIDDEEERLVWLRKAYEAALRSQNRQIRRAPKSS